MFVTEVFIGRPEFQTYFVRQFSLASGCFSSILLHGFWPYVERRDVICLWSSLMTESQCNQECGT